MVMNIYKGQWEVKKKGVSINAGTQKWMVYFMERLSKMDDDWGYPHFRKPPYIYIYT